jgi:two-component system sensor histidine kinase ArlS
MAGMKKQRLLYKTQKAYMLFSLLILLISAPLFYFLIEGMYLEDADETLALHQKEFMTYNAPGLTESDIPLWNRMSRDLKIEAVTFPLKHDSIFQQFYFDTLDQENEPYRVLLSAVSINGKAYHLRARLSMVESEDLITNIVLLFSVIMLLLLLGLYFITRYFSKKLWQPFYNTLNQIEQFEIDKNAILQFPETSVEEFYRLNSALNNLAIRNNLIYKSQQEFIENAAHELQTPLAIFQAKLETLMQQPLTQEQADVLLSLSGSAARLNRLNKNLLLLSKIDNHNYAGKEAIRLKDTIEKMLDFFTEQANEKHISIRLHAEAPGETSSNPVLAEIVISNLLLNAIRHNVENGLIHISLEKNTLTVSNNGPSAELIADKLFLRFSRSGTVSHGSGLGLAIIKKIADLNDWNISYAYRENLHVFTLTF